MLRIGLTGGVACGKTTVLRMLAERGAHTIQADRIAHDLMQPAQPVYSAVVEHFGRDILLPDGRIDRPKLAARAFPARANELNRLVHPAVIEYQEQWMNELARTDPEGIAVVEAALILEAGLHEGGHRGRRFDRLVVVTCGMEQKVERFAERHQFDREAARAEVERRMAAQISEEEKVRAADYVIDNSGSVAETERQVDRLFAELQRLAQQSQARG